MWRINYIYIEKYSIACLLTETGDAGSSSLVARYFSMMFHDKMLLHIYNYYINYGTVVLITCGELIPAYFNRKTH